MLDDILTDVVDCGIADASPAYNLILAHVKRLERSAGFDKSTQGIVVALMYVRYSREKKSEIQKINSNDRFNKNLRLIETKQAWRGICDEKELANLFRDATKDVSDFTTAIKNAVLAESVSEVSKELRSIRAATDAIETRSKEMLAETKAIKTDTQSLKKTRWQLFVSEIHWIKSLFAKPLERTVTFLILTVVSIILLALAKHLMPGAIRSLAEFLTSIIDYLKK